MEINFRPHHFLCALCFQGRGYSPAFVSNFQAIMNELNAPHGEATPISIVAHTDSLCDPCPNRMGKSCQTEEKIVSLDHAHGQALDIKAGDTLTWGQAKNRIAEKISLEKFHAICSSCNWKSLGLCEGVVREFLNK
jgi:uncharacterized protein